MGSASREALAQVRSTLTEQLGAATGAELLQAAAQIGASPALLGSLGDPSAEVASKARVVEQLFGSLGADARRVLTAAVSARWSNADEFVAGIEELGLRAEAFVNPELADELLAVVDLLSRSHELQLTLGSKLGDTADKVSLVLRLIDGKISASAVTVVAHLVGNLGGRRLDGALREAARIAADQQGRELATVTVATPLTAEQQARLARQLEQTAARPVKITTIIEPELIGGVRIQLADDVIDGSVRARLDDLRLQLAG